MFAGMGIWILYTCFSVSQQQNAMNKWTPTQAIVYMVYKEQGNKRVGLGAVPQLKTGIRYKYEVNDQSYKGETRLSDGDARTFLKGDQITVRVNPANPAESDFDWVNQPQPQSTQ